MSSGMPSWSAVSRKKISERTTKPWRVMEICGGQTHAIMRFGIDDLLPEKIDLVHGPWVSGPASLRLRSLTKLSSLHPGRRSSSARSATCCGFRGAAVICLP